jgi:hypothetical protein
MPAPIVLSSPIVEAASDEDAGADVLEVISFQEDNPLTLFEDWRQNTITALSTPTTTEATEDSANSLVRITAKTADEAGAVLLSMIEALVNSQHGGKTRWKPPANVIECTFPSHISVFFRPESYQFFWM